MISEIVITQNYDDFIKEMLQKHKICKIYSGDEFLLDDAREIMQNAHLMEECEKYFILAYKDYSIQAQNYMLKLLEEPPNMVYFKILVKSRNILLATVKSRLICRKINSAKNEESLNLNLKTYSLLDIVNFSTQLDSSTFITTLFKECIKQNIRLSEKMLNEFFQCYELSKLNLNTKVIITRLLLGIMRERS